VFICGSLCFKSRSIAQKQIFDAQFESSVPTKIAIKNSLLFWFYAACMILISEFESVREIHRAIP